MFERQRENLAIPRLEPALLQAIRYRHRLAKHRIAGLDRSLDPDRIRVLQTLALPDDFLVHRRRGQDLLGHLRR